MGPLRGVASDVNKDFSHKDQDQVKDLWNKDKDKDFKNFTSNDKDKDQAFSIKEDFSVKDNDQDLSLKDRARTVKSI